MYEDDRRRGRATRVEECDAENIASNRRHAATIARPAGSKGTRHRAQRPEAAGAPVGRSRLPDLSLSGSRAAGYPPTMSESAPQLSPSEARAEADSLLSVLERNRRTFAWKTSGLDQKGLRATTAASAMTLGGLVKHVALVEADWLAVKLAGQDYGAPWDAVDFDADPDWEWRTGTLDSPEEVYAVWRCAVDRSRALVAEVIKERGLDGPASFS